MMRAGPVIHSANCQRAAALSAASQRATAAPVLTAEVKAKAESPYLAEVDACAAQRAQQQRLRRHAVERAACT